MHKENYVQLDGRLPKFEIVTYFICYIGAVLYSIYRVKEAGDALAVDNVHNFFTDGWIIGRRKVYEYEWEMLTLLIFQLTPWLIFHLIISECIKIAKLTRYMPYFHVFTAVVFVTYNTNVKMLLLTLFQPVFFQLFGKFNSKRFVWFVGLLNLLILNCCKDFVWTITGTSRHACVITTLTIFWMNLRCLCYCLDNVGSSPKRTLIFAYCLYLPLLYLGPFVPYCDYEKSTRKSNTGLKLRLRTLVLEILRYAFWFFVVEICLHYVYVNAFSFQSKFVEKLDSWTLYGYGYSMGQLFHLKYVLYYGISTSIAKFDNIPAPGIPKCIARVHLYSNMWKYFDRGLYIFLLRYIYIPILRDVPKSSKLVANLICFGFVFVWHGLFEKYILFWASLNCATISVEMLSKSLYKNHLVKYFPYVGGSWERRFSCVLAAPLLAVSIISNFYFFAGITIGNIFFKRLFTDDSERTFVLLFLLYCLCQVGTEVKKWESLKQIKNKNA